MIDYGFLKILQVRRSAAVVDVEAVGLGADRDDASARCRVGNRCERGSSAVGAVDHNGESSEWLARRARQMRKVQLSGVVDRTDAADPGTCR